MTFGRRSFLALVVIPCAILASPRYVVAQTTSTTGSQTAEQIQTEIFTECHVNTANPATTTKERAKQARCLAKATATIRASIQMQLRTQSYSTQLANVQQQIAAQQVQPPSNNQQKAIAATAVNAGGAGQPVAGDLSGGGTSSGDLNPSALPYVGGSASGTPSTCGTGSNQPDASLIRVHRSVLDPRTTMDDFGYRLGKRFVVYQVTVENLNQDYQFKLEDVGVDFTSLVTGRQNSHGVYVYTASSQDLSLLRGVPEAGQDLDPKNLSYNLLKGIGSVAAGVSGLTPFSDVMGGAMAQFNGPFLSAFTSILPDHSANQLNRLSDSAFTANAIVDKKTSKVFAIFVPIDEVMDKIQRKEYFHDTYDVASLTSEPTLLFKADVCVDGTFIQSVVLTPSLTSVTVPSSAAASQKTTVTVAGANLINGDTQLVIGSDSNATSALISTSDGKSGTAQITLPSNFVAGTTTATAHSSSNATGSSSSPVKVTSQAAQ